jgi:predicted nucleotidyltransferase
MDNTYKMQIIMNELVINCRILFGNKLSDIILYGSYARGDYNEYSDVDVMILLEMDRVEAKKSLGRICEIASEIDIKHDVFLSPIIRSIYDFNKLKKLPGFYNNVMREGVSVLA